MIYTWLPIVERRFFLYRHYHNHQSLDCHCYSTVLAGLIQRSIGATTKNSCCIPRSGNVTSRPLLWTRLASSKYTTTMDTLAATVAPTHTPVDTVTTDIPHHEESHPPKLDATDVTRTVFSPPTNTEVVDPSKGNDPNPITTRTMTDRRSNHHHHPNPRGGGGKASSLVSSMSSSRKRLTTTELVQLDQKKNKNRNDTDKNDDDDTSKNQKEHTTPDHFHTNDLYAMRSRTINRGSYAHEPQRQLFQVTFEDDPPSSHLPPPARTKRKVTMLMGYLGTNYGGFQINEGVRSIQSELELALYRNQYISRDNFGCPQKYHWSTSGRTDKGVHAAAQVVSMKMELLPHELQTTCHGDDDDDDNDDIATGSSSSSGSRNEMLHRINASLPNDIRIFDICRTNKNFTAKIQRDYVQYRYLIPSIYFYPRDQLNTIMTKTIVSCTPLNTTTTVLERQPQVEDHHDQHYSTTNKNNNTMTTKHTANSNEDSVVPPSNATPQTQPPPQWHITPEEVRQIYDVIADYRSTLELRQVLQSTVKQYVGTHSFHNFTKRCTAKEARSARYIMDFIVEEPMIMETTIPGTHQTYQMEWIPVNVIGQSFLLNQIRKMVWFAIEIARGAIPATALNVALQRNPSPTATSSVPVHIGMAPAQGLFLDMSYYKNYNEKILRAKNSPQTNNDAVGELNWHLEHTVAHRRWKEFRNNVITQHIAQEEVQHGNFLQQIYMEEHRSYFYQQGTTKDEEEEEEEEENDDE